MEFDIPAYTKWTKGKIIKLFKTWFFEVDSDGQGGILYSNASTPVNHVRTATPGAQWTTSLTWFGSAASSGPYSFDWNGWWDSTAPDDIQCGTALLAFVAAVIAFAATLPGAEFPPDWVLIAGAFALMMNSLNAFESQCPG